MIDNVLLFVACAVAGYVAHRRGYARGYACGCKDTAEAVKLEIGATVVEWRQRADKGEVERALELPGLLALQRMLQ